MGRNDTCEKAFMADNTIFADVVNGVIFHGEQKVRPEDLEEQDSTEAYARMVNGTLLEKQKYRDVLKNVIIREDDHCKYMLVGIENQTAVNYAMVARVMLYDAINYMDQADVLSKQSPSVSKHDKINTSISGFCKGETLTPVITIVVYFGVNDWDAPRSLHELLPDDLPQEVIDLIPDYKITVLSPREVEDPLAFKTSIRAIIKALAVGKKENKSQMKEMMDHDPDFLSVDSRAATIINRVTKMGIKIPKNQKEVNMCEAVREWREELLTEGHAEGKAEGEAIGTVKGEAKFARLISAMSEQSDSVNIAKVATDPVFRAEMYEKYGIE